MMIGVGQPIPVFAEGPTVTISAPGNVTLGTLPYSVVTAKQVVASSTDGSVIVTDLGAKTYTLSVTGSATGLSKDGLKVTYLDNALLIATGQDEIELGDVSIAVTKSSGDYNGGDTSAFVALTGAEQQIGTVISSNMTLKLIAFQKIDALEDHHSGSYSVTLTYSYTLSD